MEVMETRRRVKEKEESSLDPLLFIAGMKNE
jgi:hypothetical protein